MSKVVDHPVFDQLLKRFQSGDYITKICDGDWDISIKFKFKSGFCRGVKVSFNTIRGDRSFRSFNLYVSTGFFAQTRWFGADDIPEELYTALHEKAKLLLNSRYERNQQEREAFRLEALDNCL